MSNDKERSKPRVILYTGKGGTGKSVIACATGLKAASIGYETLIISSDPAHTLGDALEKRVEDIPTKVSERLWAIQIDPIREMQKNYVVIQEWLTSLLSAKGIDETLAYEIASLPGMNHLFTLLKIEELAKKRQFDVIILDTVPSGEALKYLYFPKLFGSISRKLISMVGSIAGIAKILEPFTGLPTPTKEVFKSEVELIKRLEKLAEILRDTDVTSLRLIANPDGFSIENTRRTLMISSLYGINVDLAIVNKVMPEEVRDPYFSKWIKLQKKYLSEAEVGFYPLPIKRLMLFDSELKGLEMLRKSGEDLFCNEDPTQVYFKGSPFRLMSEGRELILVVRVPFTSKEKISNVERIGEELLVKVSTDIGDVARVIPLPSAALGMKLSRAKLLSDELHICFVDEHE
ncbi:MAG: TRC40/GET3/ArsA family transport-energizing ATPase [Nitrososphaerales archaeon]